MRCRSEKESLYHSNELSLPRVYCGMWRVEVIEVFVVMVL